MKKGKQTYRETGTQRQRDTEKHARTLQRERHRERHTWSKRSPFAHKYLWSAYYNPSQVWGQSRAKERTTLLGLRTTEVEQRQSRRTITGWLQGESH